MLRYERDGLDGGFLSYNPTQKKMRATCEEIVDKRKKNGKEKRRRKREH